MSLSKNSKIKYERMKTLCTLDSNDIVLNQDLYRSLIPKKKASHSRNKKKLTLLNQSPEKKIDNLTFTNYYQSRTPNNKARRLKTSFHKSRLKTQNFDILHQKTPKKQQSCNKKIHFHCDEKYNFQTYQIVKKISQSKDQKTYIVRYLHSFLKTEQYIMKKSKNNKKLKQFERQLQIKQQLTSKMKINEKKYFSTVFKHYLQKKNLVLVFNSYGTQLNWHNDTHTRFVKNLIKNGNSILKHMIKQLTKAILILSSYGYAHSSIEFRNILVQIEDSKQTLKVSKSIKLSKLGNCVKMTQKKSFLKMNASLSTPPQIINYMIFQNQSQKCRIQNFDRQLIEFIEIQDQGWRIDVWSLGILILEFLNLGPLLTQYLTLGQILQYQKQIKLKSQFLLQKLQDESLKDLILKMLQKNPSKRPSPHQILSILSHK